VQLRLVSEDDSWEELTTLLHRAYAPLAAQGMRFSATHQTPEVTRKRAARGECWVGMRDGRMIATVTVVPPGRGGGCAWYRREGVAKLNQMAVLPECKGQGLGRQLLAHAEARVVALGARELALDTAVHAQELHQLYFRHGFRWIGPADWRPHVNYLSVILSKDLSGRTPASPAPGWARSREDAWQDRGEAVLRMFGRVWKGLPDKLEMARGMGYRWSEVSTAYLVEDLAHVGVMEVAGVLEGRQVAMAGVHAVGTDPSARGRGLGRQALQRALRHVDERVGTAFLTTSIPGWFEPMGFRVVPEHRFRVLRPLPWGQGAPLRRLSAERPEDVALVRRLLEARIPPSQTLSLQEFGWFFVIDELLAHGGFDTLWVADDLDVVVSWQRRGDRAELLDLVGAELPPLAEIAARLPGDLQGMDVLFCPDQLDVPTEPVPGAPDETVLMVRGDWPVQGPLVLPVHWRC
jgi:GNAT superfamily N-acetyltransferase